MQLMHGQTLLELITQYHRSHRSSRSKLQELLRYFVDACRTISYAHANHVVHRDIKPANIMRSGFGETFVLDWGADEDQRNLTTLEGRIGTLGYQSPEYLTRGVSRPSPADRSQAATYLREAAEGGYAVAEFAWGKFLLRSPKSESRHEAALWIRRAAEQNYPRAIEFLKANPDL